MRRLRMSGWIVLIAAVAFLAGCQSSRAQTADASRLGVMADPQSGSGVGRTTTDNKNYTRYDP